MADHFGADTGLFLDGVPKARVASAAEAVEPAGVAGMAVVEEGVAEVVDIVVVVGEVVVGVVEGRDCMVVALVVFAQSLAEEVSGRFDRNVEGPAEDTGTFASYLRCLGVWDLQEQLEHIVEADQAREEVCGPSVNNFGLLRHDLAHRSCVHYRAPLVFLTGVVRRTGFGSLSSPLQVA